MADPVIEHVVRVTLVALAGVGLVTAGAWALHWWQWRKRK